MANLYQIKSTAGDKTITIQPLQINGSLESTADSDVNLIGQGTSQWGANFNESLYHIVENFACPEKAGTPGMPQDENDISPIGTGLGINNPINGQLWFNTTTNKLLVYNTAGSPPVNAFQTVNGITSGTVIPSAPFIGDLWYDTSVPQLKIYNGASFISIADRYLLLDGTRAMEGTLFIGDGTATATGRSLIISEQFGGGDPNIKFRNTALEFTTSIVDEIGTNDLVITKVGLGSPANSTTLTLHTGGNVSLAGGSNIPTLDAHLTRRDFVFNTFVELGGDTMTGNLTFGDTNKVLIGVGTAAAPALAFAGSTNTGIFTPSSGAEVLNFSTAGIERLNIESNGTLNVGGTANYELLVTTDDDIPNMKWVEDAIALALAASVPTGTISMFGAAAAPTGYLLCNGASVSTTTYANLHAIIGYTYGGSGSLFSLPNFAGRSPMGVGASAGNRGGSSSIALGELDGDWVSKLTSINQLYPHSHGGGSHAHTLYMGGGSSGPRSALSVDTSHNTAHGYIGTNDATQSSGSIINSEGSGSAFATHSPVYGMHFIIKT